MSQRTSRLPESYAAITHASGESDPLPNLVSHNLILDDKRTSIRIEPDMWAALNHIMKREGRSINEICSLINRTKPGHSPLTSAIRVFIMSYFMAAATEEGHARAGHGYGKILYPSLSDR